MVYGGPLVRGGILVGDGDGFGEDGLGRERVREETG